MAEERKAGAGKVQFRIDTAPGPLLDLGRNKPGKNIGQEEHQQESDAQGKAPQLE